MNSEKDLKNNFPNKKTKTKKQNPKISNDKQWVLAKQLQVKA